MNGEEGGTHRWGTEDFQHSETILLTVTDPSVYIGQNSRTYIQQEEWGLM